MEQYSSTDEIKEMFFDELRNEINKKAECGRSRYSMYKLINPNLQIPSVYNEIKTKYEMEILSRLRTGSHNLKIETGRQSRIPKEFRLCNCGEVEDEPHFLLECVNYYNERLKYGITPENRLSDILSKVDIIGYLKEIYFKRSQIIKD